jgi:hypothetical protein
MLKLFFLSFVTACHDGSDVDTPKFFRNYKNPRWPQSDFDDIKVWESACATASTSTFIRPSEIRQNSLYQKFVKAPLEWNNPVKFVYREARDLWPDDEFIMLSIGTGAAPKGESDLEAIVKEAEKIADEFPIDHEKMVRHDNYFRFNVVQGMDKIRPIELREWAELAQDVDAYLNSPANELVFKRCVESLKSAKTTQGTAMPSILM